MVTDLVAPELDTEDRQPLYHWRKRTRTGWTPSEIRRAVAQGLPQN